MVDWKKVTINFAFNNENQDCRQYHMITLYYHLLKIYDIEFDGVTGRG